VGLEAPAVIVGSTPDGPAEETFFKEFLREFLERTRATYPVDGVYLYQHGTAVVTHTHDPDGDVFALVRGSVGSDVPLITTLDLHANVSEVMMDITDMLIGYRTNEDVGMYERGEELARTMFRIFDGSQPACGDFSVIFPGRLSR
jgi:microcystin degradation protein MlrC